jgi:hypothetical protein
MGAMPSLQTGVVSGSKRLLEFASERRVLRQYFVVGTVVPLQKSGVHAVACSQFGVPIHRAGLDGSSSIGHLGELIKRKPSLLEIGQCIAHREHIFSAAIPAGPLVGEQRAILGTGSLFLKDKPAAFG